MRSIRRSFQIAALAQGAFGLYLLGAALLNVDEIRRITKWINAYRKVTGKD